MEFKVNGLAKPVLLARLVTTWSKMASAFFFANIFSY